ncbi:MAG: rod shape-determining protein RodA [SAR86 cluster bacterium]|jgi:rod shape determining protein RodA|nr:rod shape-determining protein RodA [SAR86 cluster bacterium]
MSKLRPLEHSLNTSLVDVSFSKKITNFFGDLPLVISLLLILIFGLFVLYSASGQSTAMVIRQSLYITLGLILMFFFSRIKLKVYEEFSLHFIWIAIGLLVLVLFFPAEGYKTNRWIDLGFISFQPSEIVRFILPLAIVSYLTKRKINLSFIDWSVAFIATLICAFLVLKQPDLGTSLIVAMSGFLPLFLAGFPRAYLFTLAAFITAMSPFIWTSLKEYQRQRIITLFNPDADPLGAGWNISQSKTAIGSGGLSGKGYLEGTQSQLDFIPESHSDFIFAVIGEEFGFLGIIILLIVYLVIFARCLKIALNSKTEFGRLASSCLASIFIIYLLVNILMVVGLIPVVGVPLPLISQGGTSILIHLLSFGVILSVRKEDMKSV